MANGEGGFIGSDLSSYAGNRPVEDVRSAITDPDKNLDPRKRPVTVTTVNGKNANRNGSERGQLLAADSGAGRIFPFLYQVGIAERRIPGAVIDALPTTGPGSAAQELDDSSSYLMSIGRANRLRNSNKPPKK